MSEQGTPQKSALFLSAFFGELLRCGVGEVVVSPGSRSTPLALVAHASPLELYVDVDERGAAFFALGLAKASKSPVCLICTSGTAAANYLPAIMEAQASRVPLIVLTADRPLRLQGLGAPQTCDQVKMFGDAVRCFRQMPLPASEPRDLAFARQMALEACIHATGFPGAVHFNFPFEEPLKPDMSLVSFEKAESGIVIPERNLQVDLQDRKKWSEDTPGIPQAETIANFISEKRGIILCSEGTFETQEEAEQLLKWAEKMNLPLIADPLSGLRQYDHPCVIDAYGGIFGSDDCPPIDFVIRFGQYPISKRCFSAIETMRPVQIVVDPFETRDFNYATDLFVRATPAEFVCQMLRANDTRVICSEHLAQWIELNEKARQRVSSVVELEGGFEGSFVYRLLGLAPEGSLIFSGNSLAIRIIDTFYLKQNKQLTCLCNRGLNGIDGTTSSALGAAQHFAQTTYFAGDLTFLHDINALALQEEILMRHDPEHVPSIVIVVFNNNGGGIFDMLPQKSDEPYYERLFTTTQKVDFGPICHGFAVTHQKTDNAEEAARIYEDLLGSPGISVLEISVPLDGFKQRYERYL